MSCKRYHQYYQVLEVWHISATNWRAWCQATIVVLKMQNIRLKTQPSISNLVKCLCGRSPKQQPCDVMLLGKRKCNSNTDAHTCEGINLECAERPRLRGYIGEICRWCLSWEDRGRPKRQSGVLLIHKEIVEEVERWIECESKRNAHLL
jgi:hypothetical protein